MHVKLRISFKNNLLFNHTEIECFLYFFFIISRWGKERPLNTRLLIQNVGLPTHDIDCVPGLEGNEGTSSDKLGSNEEAPWEVQVFRSITSDSAR